MLIMTWLALLGGMGLMALVAWRAPRPASSRLKIAELVAISLSLIVCWRLAPDVTFLELARAGALLVLSYGLSRIASDGEGSRHLLPAVAFSTAVLAGGDKLLSLGTSWLPVGCGLVILGSPRMAVAVTIIALGPTAIAVTAGL